MARFKMTARDVDTSPTQHRTWVVSDQPDMDGYYYTGIKGGANDFIDTYAYSIPDGYVVDFNLPNVTDWNTTYRTLPEPTCDSHLLVLDGYIFLFGGKESNSIFKAEVGNPAYWLDTEFTLPSNFSGGQLAVVDGYIYIFGGNDGYASDKIYSASTSDPLTWTDDGYKLPRALYHSQLYLDDGYIYLFGGNDGYGPVNFIFSAPMSDPLTWAESVAILPGSLTGSHLAAIDGYVYLIGGLLDGVPTTNIYRAPKTDLASWSLDGYLPHTAHFGQLATVGSKAYLFAIDGYVTQTYNTKIFECNLSNPLVWTVSSNVINGSISQSQLAFVGDRIFLFGGNGSSIIFTHSYDLVYSYNSAAAVIYGDVTRTQYQAVTDGYAKFDVLGFPYWKTNY